MTRLLLTLPVIAASAERSFNTLRRLKTWLRNTMVQKRWTSLSLCNVYKKLQTDINVTELCKDFISRTDERRNYKLLFIKLFI